MEKIMNKDFALSVLKGVLVSLCITLVLILLFAVILRFVDMNDTLVSTVNQIIKVVSVFLGVMASLKKNSVKGLYKGMMIGILYTFLAFLVFSLLDGSFAFGVTLIFDLLFALIIGAVCGLICVNFKKKERI
ncbi:MAG: TIGR04086 family membrane protein [Christensenellaceae bacterium]|jgi:putative membrane protein (TIGR04086 family)|nr:TIGR04086 family membrane protein [Christensenellaceae bacterium]